MSRLTTLCLLLSLVLPLAACDQLGIDTPAHQEAEAKAIGGGCRHSGLALEDCYISYPKVSKAAIYAGWREMDGYMRDNHIATVPATLAIPSARNAQRVDCVPVSELPKDNAANTPANAPASAPPGNAPATTTPPAASPAGQS